MGVYVRKQDPIYMLLVGAFFIIIAFVSGFRPVMVGTDTILYSELYQELLDGQEGTHTFEFIYNLSAVFFSSFGVGQGLFFSFVSGLSLFFVYCSFFKFNVYFRNVCFDSDLFLYGFLLLLVSPVFLSAQVNVVRQGVACLALICFYSCILGRHFGLLLFSSAIVAFGFHSTSILFLIVGIGLLFSYSHVMILTFIIAIAYSLGISELLVRTFSALSGLDIYTRVIEYGAMENYKSGVRLDFTIFSCVLGLFLDLLSRLLLSSKQRFLYQGCLKIYWLFLIPFFILGFGAFSDRFLFNAWLYSSVIMGIVLSQAHFFKRVPRSLILYACFSVVIVYIYLVQVEFYFSSDLIN